MRGNYSGHELSSIWLCNEPRSQNDRDVHSKYNCIHRSTSIRTIIIIMAEDSKAVVVVVEQLQDELDALNAAITKQGSHVRTLKKGEGSADEIAEAVAALQALKLDAATKAAVLQSGKASFNRKSFDELVVRKMFVIPSFEIHGGVKGLFDLGPPACALKVSNTESCILHIRTRISGPRCMIYTPLSVSTRSMI